MSIQNKMFVWCLTNSFIASCKKIIMKIINKHHLIVHHDDDPIDVTHSPGQHLELWNHEVTTHVATILLCCFYLWSVHTQSKWTWRCRIIINNPDMVLSDKRPGKGGSMRRELARNMAGVFKQKRLLCRAYQSQTNVAIAILPPPALSAV